MHLTTWLGIYIEPTAPNLDNEPAFVHYQSVLRSYDAPPWKTDFDIFTDDTAYSLHFATPTVAKSAELNTYSIHLILLTYCYYYSWLLFKTIISLYIMT